MRSPLWFVLAAVIGIGGFVVAGFNLFSGLGAFEGRMKQVVMPGSATLDLSEAGVYTIFHERNSVVDGRAYSSNGMAGLRLSVFADDGSELNLTPSGGSTYSFNGREGRSVFAFQVAKPGKYRITGTLPDGRTEPKIVLALGVGVLGGMFKMIGLSIAFAFGGIAVAALIVILTVIGRGKARRAGPVS
ncbi:MAG: hypothetical protein AB7O88_26765 [Reyranellaceae bacterium]